MSKELRGSRPSCTDAAEETQTPGGPERADENGSSAAAPRPIATNGALKNAEWPVVSAGRYEVEGEHARGGLGRVLAACDTRMDRKVAVKELLTGGRNHEARFIREALVTARLQHPAIVPVYEVGRWPNGKPFYSMKMVEGRSLSALIKEKKTLQERLALLPNVIAVADAMAYAHGQHVIHRDLKPSNILIGPFGETMVIDWGLATDLSHPERGMANLSTPYQIAAAGLTVVGAVMGTPEYMPPEQAEGKAVDERADVYALGAILYHVLAGSPPYTGESSAEVLEKVSRVSPAPLEQRQLGVPRDLAAIVGKAMARNVEERYPSAKEFADELKRFQTGQLVSAYNYSPWALTRRWIQRRRLPLALIAIFLLLLSAISFISVRRVVRERNASEAQRRIAEEQKNELILTQARNALDRDPTESIAWLKRYQPSPSSAAALDEIVLDARGRGISRHVLKRSSSIATEVDFSPDGKFVIAPGANHQIMLTDLNSGRPIKVLPYQGEVLQVRFAPNGRSIAANLYEGKTPVIWSLDSAQMVSLEGHTDVITSMDFSKNGQFMATSSSDKAVRLWSLDGQSRGVLLGHQARVTRARFSPNSEILASADASGEIRIWSIPDGAQLSRINYHHEIRDMAFSRNGQSLGFITTDGSLVLCSASHWICHSYAIGQSWSLVFSPDSKQVAMASRSGTISILEIASGSIASLPGHAGPVYTVDFSATGALLASGGEDGTVRLWELPSGGQRILRGHKAAVMQVTFSGDSNYLASSADDGTVRIWSVTDILGESHLLVAHSDQIQDLSFSHDGAMLSSTAYDGSLKVWYLQDGHSISLSGHSDILLRAIFSPDDRVLVSSGFDRTIRLWNLSNRSARVVEAGTAVWDISLSHTGATVASAGIDGSVGLLDVSTGKQKTLRGHTKPVRIVAFSPDDKFLLSSSEDGTSRAWRLSDLSSVPLKGHAEAVSALAILPSGDKVVTGSYDRTIRLWDLWTGEGRIIGSHSGSVRAVASSPRGDLIASGGEDRVVKLWTTNSGKPYAELKGHRGLIRTLAFSAKGDYLASAGYDGTVRVWDTYSGRLLDLRRHKDLILRVTFSPDSKYVASASSDGTIGLWSFHREINEYTASEYLARLQKRTTAVLGSDDGMATTQ